MTLAQRSCQSTTATLPPSSLFTGGHDSWHLIAVTKGGFSQECGSVVHEVRAGECRLSSPKASHRMFIGSEQLECSIFLLPASWVATSPARLAMYPNIFSDDVQAFSDLVAESPTDDGWPTRIRRDLRVRAALARVRPIGEGAIPDAEPEWLGEARELLSAKDSKVDAVARRIGLSREHFSRSFARHQGCSPAGYRGALKLASAVELVTSSNTPMADIAVDMGYADQSHLTHSITALTGTSPGKLRRNSATPIALFGN